MSRLAPYFAALKKQRRAALVPYIMAGDPAPWVTVPLMHAIVRAGANVIELGIPFSDPMADGPVIQRAAVRALKQGMTLARVLEMVKEFRTKDAATPIVLMGYLNPVETMGYTAFAEAAAAAGVDGLLTIDLPPEEASDILTALRRCHIDPIFFLAPTSGAERMRAVAEVASGYIYYLSLRGVTGATHLDLTEVMKKTKAIRAHTHLPIGVGFGIRAPETAAQVASFADAVIVGTAIVARMEQNAAHPERLLAEVPPFVTSLRGAMDKALEEEAVR